MTGPIVTIIVACYNARNLIGGTLDSILAQTFKDYEIIIIDGASNDGTATIIQSYEFAITRWVSEPDLGIYDAWNKGLKFARGSWISFLGAGDLYLPDTLMLYIKHIEATPNVDFVSGKAELFSLRGQTRIIGKCWKWNCFKRYMCVAHVGALHSRNLFDLYGNFDTGFRVCGDYDFLLRPRSNLRTIFINQVLVRMLSGGISETNQIVHAETRMAKLRNHAVTPMIAYWDSFVALIKWHLRNLFRLL